MKISVLIFGLVYLLGVFPENADSHLDLSCPVLGSWMMKEVHWITKDTTYSIPYAQPGIFIFTPKSYSIMWTPRDAPREPFRVLAKPTEEELKNGFQTVVFNAGTYEWTDSTITSTAIIAKVPGFEGGKQYYRYAIEDDILRITMFDETYPDGEKPEWFGKYVTQFVLSRIDSWSRN